MDYSSNYELLHFTYDLLLFCAIAAKKNAIRGQLPLRVAMKKHNWSPLYWRDVHFALTDMVRQIGYPCAL